MLSNQVEVIQFLSHRPFVKPLFLPQPLMLQSFHLLSIEIDVNLQQLFLVPTGGLRFHLHQFDRLRI